MKCLLTSDVQGHEKRSGRVVNVRVQSAKDRSVKTLAGVNYCMWHDILFTTDATGTMQIIWIGPDCPADVEIGMKIPSEIK